MNATRQPAPARRPDASGPNPRDGAVTVYVSPGTFSMGSTDGFADERPVHPVRLTRGFRVYRAEVTVAQFRAYVEATAAPEPLCFANAKFNAPDQPVVGVSWYEAEAY